MCKEKDANCKTRGFAESEFNLLNDFFGGCLLFGIPSFDIVRDFIEKELDNKNTVKHGKSVEDKYVDGKHVKHVEKKLNEDGEWVPVEGKCCSLTKEDEAKKAISVNKSEITPLGSCEIKQDGTDCEDEITRLKNTIQSYMDGNRRLEEENARLRGELDNASKQLTKFNKLVEGLSRNFNDFIKEEK